MSAPKVTLRKRLLPSGKVTLYLDFYPAVRNPKTLKLTRREYLGIYLIKSPRTLQDREENAKKLRIADGIRSQREISILNEQYGFVDKATAKMDFLKWYRTQLESNNKNWAFAYNYFYEYVHGQCTMADITIELCKGFRQYLLDATMLTHEGKKLSQNSASGYYSTFRALLNIAYRDHLINENVNDYLESIPDVETRREYLTLEELQKLADTPCKIPVLKAASLFSCLTGLRISDILALRWENIESYPDGGACLRLKTEKTETETTLPISAEALELCGKRTKGIVFKGLTRQMTQHHMQVWLKDAGITKHITFHCFRHTNATLLLDQGTDIYTVSKMLTHRNVSTTQIYTEVMDQKKRKAAESITIRRK